jgi:hypothetical protein
VTQLGPSWLRYACGLDPGAVFRRVLSTGPWAFRYPYASDDGMVRLIGLTNKPEYNNL